jgi:PqqD family protein of HPr-rel-A system
MSGAPEKRETVWGVPPQSRLAWRVWDDEFLVYNTASGQTHHLNFLAGEALRSLEAEPGSASDLVCRLADQFEIAADSPPLRTIDRLIREFDELGLIAPSTS